MFAPSGVDEFPYSREMMIVVVDDKIQMVHEPQPAFVALRFFLLVGRLAQSKRCGRRRKEHNNCQDSLHYVPPSNIGYSSQPNSLIVPELRYHAAILSTS